MSTTLQARIGRHLQRYENHFRLVAGCIPYRLKQNVENPTGDLLSKLEVLMITSPDRDDLVFPKGGWENDETVDEAACREALEEAGVRGIIHDTLLGVWEFRSKSKENLCSQEGACRGYMFALQVTEELEFWPEQSTHDRKWVNVWEAWELCRYDWMREALNSISILLTRKPVRLMAAPEISEPTSVFCLAKPAGISEPTSVFCLAKPAGISEPTSVFCLAKPAGAKCVDSAINALC